MKKAFLLLFAVASMAQASGNITVSGGASGGTGVIQVIGGGSGGAGNPGGSPSQVQFNSAGTFNGTPLETVDSSSVSFNNISNMTINLTTMTFQTATDLDTSAGLLNVGLVQASGSAGTAGQVLTSGGSSGVTSWTTSSGANLLPSTNTWTGQEAWVSPQPSTFTYGVVAGSLTLSGSGNAVITENGISGQVVLSTTGASIVPGDCTTWSSSMTLIDSGNPCGSGGGGGASGQINSASQNQVPRYSVSGSSNVLSGASNLTNDGSLVTISTFTSSSGTVSGTLIVGTVNSANLENTSGNVTVQPHGTFGLSSINFVAGTTGFNGDDRIEDAATFQLRGTGATHASRFGMTAADGPIANGWTIENLDDTTQDTGLSIINDNSDAAKRFVNFQSIEGSDANGGNIWYIPANLYFQTDRPWVFGSSETVKGNIYISSGVLLSGSAGSNGQFLTSGGAGTVPTWTTASGSSGSSTLAISSGSATNSVIVSSPTSNVVIDSNTHIVSLQGTTTAFIALNPSSVTLQGNSVSLSALNTSTQTIQTQVTSISTLVNTLGVSTQTLAVSTGNLAALVNTLGVSTQTLAVSTGNIAALVNTLGVSTQSLAVSTGTLYTLANGKVNLSSFSATAPILYNNTTGIISATLISLTTGVTGILPAANEVSTHAYTTSTQTFTVPQFFASSVTVASTFTVTAATTILNGTTYFWPSVSGGSSGQFLQTNGATPNATLSWATASGSGGGIVSPGTFTWTNTFGISVSTLTATSTSTLNSVITSTLTVNGSVYIVNASSANSLVIATTTVGGTNLVQISSTPAQAPRDFILAVSSVSGTMAFGIQNNSHVISSGTAPSVSSCGTGSPSVLGTDMAGIITVGATSPTACTLTFAYPFVSAPVCLCGANGATACDPTSASNTAVTFTLGVTETTINYICIGNKGG